MLKSLGVLASLAAQHLAQAEQQAQLTTQTINLTDTVDFGSTASLSKQQQFDRSQVQAKKHHPRFTPERMNHQLLRGDHHRSLQSSETCSRAINRLKDESEDYNELLAQGNEDPDYTYTDTTFTFPDAIHWEDLPSREYSLSGDVENLSWQRIREVFADSFYSIWGTNGKIDVEDAIQGQLGNCWLVVAAMSIAENPQRIRDIFQIENKNSVGVYSSKMWLLGMPISVIIDDFLPLSTQNLQSTEYAQVAEDGALWGPIFEKSFAKYLGNYEAVDSGSGSHGIEAMTGAPYDNWLHTEVLADDQKKEELWQALVDTSANGAMVTCGSYTGTGSDQDVNEVGLPNNHAFSVMRVLTVDDDQNPGTTHRLVEMRNPWGNERFFGDWSDSSDRWTQAMREQVGHLSDDDGKYYMSFNDYIKYTEYTDISRDVYGWSHSAFAILGDDDPVDRQTVFRGDPTEYNKHVLLVESPVDQLVSLSVHAYSIKHYQNMCQQSLAAGTEILLQRPSENILQQAHPGALHDPLFEMEAGSTYVATVWTHFGDDDLLPHDWSLIAWASDEPVTITHQSGIKSDSFDYVSRDTDIPTPEITDATGSEPLTYDELMRMGDLSSLSGQSGGLTEEQQAEKDYLNAKFKIWRQANGLFDSDIQTVYESQILIQVEALTWEMLVEYDALNQKRVQTGGNLDAQDSADFMYYDTRFWYWMQANDLANASPREVLDAQLLSTVQPLSNLEVLEYVELDRMNEASTLTSENTDKYDLFELRLDTLLEVNEQEDINTVPQLLAQLVYDQTAETLSYSELRGFATLNNDLRDSPEDFSIDVKLAFALVQENFNEWLTDAGYDKVDPEAPGETILAQLTLQTIEAQWENAGQELLRLKLLKSETDLDAQEQAELDELSQELLDWIEANNQPSGDPDATLEQLISEVGSAIGKAPTDEELALLQDLYYESWSGISMETKTEVLAILRALEAHMIYKDLADKEPVDYVAELLGTETSQEDTSVVLSQIELLIWQQQMNKLDSDEEVERTSDDKTNFALLDAKLEAYISQNEATITDASDKAQIVRELLGGGSIDENLVKRDDFAVDGLAGFAGVAISAMVVLVM